MTNVRITHIGGLTALIEVEGWRLLTDPTFDPAGGKYSFGLGTGSEKLVGPSMSPEELGSVDAVLLSHDQHEDNLGGGGGEVAPAAGVGVAGVRGGGGTGPPGAGGRAPGGRTTLPAEGGPTVEIVATPCRHGPPLSKP